MSMCSILLKSVNWCTYNASGSPVKTGYDRFWSVHIIFLVYTTATGCPWDSDEPKLTVRFFWVRSGPVSVFFRFDEPDLKTLKLITYIYAVWTCLNCVLKPFSGSGIGWTPNRTRGSGSAKLGTGTELVVRFVVRTGFGAVLNQTLVALSWSLYAPCPTCFSIVNVPSLQWTNFVEV